MALSGNLRDFQFADVLQLIGQQGKTGTLRIQRETQSVHVYFRNGEVVRAELHAAEGASPLARLLVDAEVMSESQLAEVEKVRAARLMRIERALLAEEVLSEQLLREFITLQTKETLTRLFLWRRGTYEFVAGELPDGLIRAELPSSESLLMEGLRVVDEWPVLRNTISVGSETFRAVRDEFGDPTATAKGEELPPLTPVKGNDELKVLRLVRSSRDVRKLAALSRLGEFETTRVLVTLLQSGYIVPVVARPATREGLPALKDVPVEKPFAARLARFAVMLLVVGSAVFIGLMVNVSRDTGRAGTSAHIAASIQSGLLGYTRHNRVRTGVEIFRLETGRYPDTLGEVVKRGILTEHDLTAPFKTEYFYRRTRDGYDLRMPLY